MTLLPNPYEVVDIPHIPENLILGSVEDVSKKYKNVSPFPEYDKFQSWKIDDPNFIQWAQPYFSFNVETACGYQCIRDGLKTHVDVYRKEVYNYILDAGGDDVYTIFYDESHTKEIYRVKIPTRTWHKLNVKVPHNVKGITTTRLAITIFEKTENP